MEITESTIYWLTWLDAINALLVIGGFVFFAIALIFSMIPQELEWGWKRRLQFIIPSSILCVVLWVTVLFVPTTKEMVAIKLIPAIANSESARAIGDKLPKVVDYLLEIDKNEKKSNQ